MIYIVRSTVVLIGFDARHLIRLAKGSTPSPAGEGYCNRYFRPQIGANQEPKETSLLAFPCEGRGTTQVVDE